MIACNMGYFSLLQINKQNDQMYTLLSICLVLHPMRIDETVHSQLREKYSDKMLRMQKGSVLYSYECFLWSFVFSFIDAY